MYRHDGEDVERAAAEDRAVAGAESPAPGTIAPTARGKDATAGSPTDTAAPKRSRICYLGTEADAVFGLPCRSSFCQLVRNRAAEWKRGGPTFSVVLIEVDQYAQGAGHRGSEQRAAMMRKTTHFLAATVREMDTVGYYAPGCFALLLPTAGLADAIGVEERLREDFARCSPAAEGEQPKLTLSVGVAQVMERDDTISLLKRAEAASDAAERRGGNRVYCHDGERCAADHRDVGDHGVPDMIRGGDCGRFTARRERGGRCVTGHRLGYSFGLLTYSLERLFLGRLLIWSADPARDAIATAHG